MELVQTMKVRILFQKQEDIEKMKQTMLAYRDGCNLVSQYIFDQYFPLNYYVLNKALYHKLRKEHSLKANMAQSCMKTTIAATISTHAMTFFISSSVGSAKGL